MEKISDLTRSREQLFSNLNAIWNRLTKPSSDLINSEDQRKSRLVSSLLLLSIIIFSVYIISFLFFDIILVWPDFTEELFFYIITDFLALIILYVTYFVSKTKYYYPASLMFFIITSGTFILNILYEDELIFQIIFLFSFFTLLILLTSLFFSTRTVVLTFFLYVIGFLIITTVVKPLEINIILIGITFFSFQTILILLNSHYYYQRVSELELAITDRKNAIQRADFLNSLLRHDIANKIARIDGYLFLLSKQKLDEEQQKILKQTTATCNESADLIKKINYIREIEESVGFPKQKVVLNVLLSQVIDQYEDHADSNGIEIVFNDEKRIYHVLGGELLNELFSNLIENSIYHSSGTLLRISLSKTSEKISVVIEDDGVGIPETMAKTIFKRGIKGDQSKGSGIGLFLVKTIVESLDAKISVSQSTLGGAKFVITFNS